MSDKLIIKTRRGTNISQDGQEVSVTLSSQTVFALKQEVFKLTKIEPLRQWLTLDDLKTVLDDNSKPLQLCNLKNGQILVVKDLGPQTLWGTVFYIEYIGPIIMFAILYLLGQRSKYTFMQKSAFWMLVSHFLKRILETKFVHVFSRDSMPTRQALINCFHYWILCGVTIGSEIYLIREFQETPAWKWAFIGAFVGFEFLNLMCHVTLSNIRKTPTSKDYVALNKQRSIPRGWGFDQVSSANYFWEVMSWVSFTIFTGSYAAGGFTLVSFGQMLQWALDKQRRYKKEFGDKFPRSLKAMVPYII